MNRVRVLTPFIVCAVFAASCGGTTPPTESPTQTPPPATSPPAGPPRVTRPQATGDAGIASLGFAVVPLRLRMTGASGEHVVELRPDGTVVGDGQPIARVEGRRVLNPSGVEIMSVADDGTLTLEGRPGAHGPVRLTPNGELVGRNGQGRETRLSIAPDGTPVERHDDGREERAPARFEAVPAEARGTAMMITVMIVLLAPTPAPPGATNSTSAVVTASDVGAPDAGVADAGRRRPRPR